LGMLRCGGNNTVLPQTRQLLFCRIWL